MANLREAANLVDWQQAHNDAQAIARKQVTFGQLSATRQDNLQRARDVMTKIAQNESYYREQTIRRLETYEQLKLEYAKYIKQRDEAAFQGKAGSVGLAVAYSVDMVGYGLSATGIPLAKYYTTVRNVGDKAYTAYETLAPFLPSLPASGSRGASVEAARQGAAGPIGTASIPATPDRAVARAGGGLAAVRKPAVELRQLADRTPEEQIRTATRPLEAVRELHKAIETTTAMDRALPGKNQLREWKNPQPASEEHAGSTALTASNAAGQIADTSLNIVGSIAELHEARRSGDVSREFDAETKAMRNTLDGGAKLLELAQKARKLEGRQGHAEDIIKIFKATDKAVAVVQLGARSGDAYLEWKDGHYQKAWTNASEGVTAIAKTFTKYGEQTESASKAIDAMTRNAQATDMRQRVTSYMEFVGYGTKVAVVPGASDAGEAILKAKGIVEQGFNFQDARDLGRQDTFRPNLDRLGRDINEDHALYIRLNAFRPLLSLPGQPVTLNAP